ncbi:MAG TPA: DUF3429 domain-containing protein [Roseovarius sp.]|nr:DUF3429 domain-containing protein [Roseovarius sp.]
MTAVPRTPLILGLAGVIPFVWGALTVLLPGLADWTLANIGARFVGPYVMLFYGAIILSFMSGVLWGFAAQLEGARAATGYALSVIPALWAFFMTGGGPTSSGISLMVGFIGILGLDWMFWHHGAAPAWWMQLRLLLTMVVVTCLAIGVFL